MRGFVLLTATAVLVACASSVSALTILSATAVGAKSGAVRRLKATRAQVLAATATDAERFTINTKVDSAIADCGNPNVGEAKCKQLTDAAELGTKKVNTLLAYIDAHHKDSKFDAAFGHAADEAAVKSCLEKCRDGKFVLFNTWANRGGLLYKDGDVPFSGLGVENGTKKLNVGPNAYGEKPNHLAELLIHEASHAFCATIDHHGADKKNGYKDSEHFQTVKGATNADSYRVYAQLAAV